MVFKEDGSRQKPGGGGGEGGSKKDAVDPITLEKTHSNGTAKPNAFQLAETEIPEEEQCRWGPLYSGCCQVFRTPVCVLVLLCCAGILQGFIVNGLINVVISTLEKRFLLLSSTSGLIPSFYDVGSLLATFPVSFFGGRGHKPKYLGLGVMLLGLGAFLFSLPHFTTAPYLPNQRATDVGSDLCILGAANLSAANSLCGAAGSMQVSENLNDYKYVFLVAQLLHGVGACPMWILGVTYLDDNLSREESSLFIGIYYAFSVLGPAVGYLGGGAILNSHTDVDVVDSTKVLITPNHPNWVGNWWLGFLIAAFLSIFVGGIIFGFPSSLPGAKEKQAARVDETYQGKTKSKKKPDNDFESSPSSLSGADAAPAKTGVKGVCHSIFNVVKNYCVEAAKLIKNPTFVLISFSAAAEGFILSGVSAFWPKYVETIYETSASDSAMYVGGLLVIFGSLGMFVGGFVVKHFKLNCLQILKMSTFTVLLTIPPMFVWLDGCPDLPFQGLTHPVPQLANSSFGCVASDVHCKSCSDDIYSPVCSDQIMYYSPCHAGCSVTANGSFVNCLCASSGEATSGRCSDEEKCPGYKIWLFLAINAFVIFPTFFITMPAMSATLRCVPPKLTSVAVGLQLVVGRLLGTVPGSPIFGHLFDHSCRLWASDKCSASANDPDARFCIFYDKTSLSSSLVAIVVCVKVISFLCFLSAWFVYSRHQRRMKESEERNEKDAETNQMDQGRERLQSLSTPGNEGIDNPVFSISNKQNISTEL